MAAVTGAVALSAQSTLNAGDHPTVPGPNTIPGPTLWPSASVAVVQPSAVALNGAGGLAATGLYTGLPRATLAATAAFSASAQATYRTAVSWNATTSLLALAQGTYFVGQSEVQFLPAGALSIAVRSTGQGAAAFAATASFAAVARSTQRATTGALTGVAALAADAATTTKGTASVVFAPVGGLVAAGARTVVVDTLLQGDTGLVVASKVFAGGAVVVVAESSLSADGYALAYARATLAASAALAVALERTTNSAVTWSAVAALTTGPRTVQFVRATFTGAALFTTDLRTVWFIVAAPMSALAGMTVDVPVRAKVAIVELDGDTTLVATAGTYSIIPPDFVARPVQPVIETPEWHLYVADTITGRIAYEVPVREQQWASKLNDIGTATATLDIEDTYDSISAWDQRDPRVLLRQFLSGPFRYSLVFAYGNQAVWGGPYTPGTVPPSSSSVQVGANEFMYMFTRRLVMGNRNNPNGTSGDVVLGPTSKRNIAYQLIKNGTKDGATYALPWDCPDIPDTVGLDVRAYNGFDLGTTWDALSMLSAENNGPDVRFDPELYYTDSGLFVRYHLRIGDPDVRDDTVWAWDVPSGATLQWDSNVQNFATSYWGIGAGQDRERLITRYSNSELTRIGFPALDITDALYSSVTDYYQLQSLIQADMQMYSTPARKWTLKVLGNREPLIGSFRVGDLCDITVRRHPVIEDGQYARRITEIAGDSSDWVDVMSSDDYYVQSSVMEGVSPITT